METPRTDHLTAQDYAHVYEPAQDSFLLLDALERDLPFLLARQPRLCLEMGSGSGVVVTAVAQQLRHSLCLATDINGRASVATRATARHNHVVNLDAIGCSLADAVRPRTVDLLLFNPPYVVTPDEELEQSKRPDEAIVKSWAGGVRGRRVVDVLLEQLDGILSPCGVLYLLLLRENDPAEVMERLAALNFEAAIFMERRIPGEYLYIIKVMRVQRD